MTALGIDPKLLVLCTSLHSRIGLASNIRPCRKCHTLGGLLLFTCDVELLLQSYNKFAAFLALN